VGLGKRVQKDGILWYNEATSGQTDIYGFSEFVHGTLGGERARLIWKNRFLLLGTNNLMS
jgi:hypothetical protein